MYNGRIWGRCIIRHVVVAGGARDVLLSAGGGFFHVAKVVPHCTLLKSNKGALQGERSCSGSLYIVSAGEGNRRASSYDFICLYMYICVHTFQECQTTMDAKSKTPKRTTPRPLAHIQTTSYTVQSLGNSRAIPTNVFGHAGRPMPSPS